MAKSVKYVIDHSHPSDGKQELKAGTKRPWYVRLVLS